MAKHHRHRRGMLAAVVLSGLLGYTHGQEAKPDPAELLRAVESSDLEGVRLMLSFVPPDVKDAKGQTALMAAAKTGSFEICRALLWSGADANAVDSTGKTAKNYLKGDHAGFSALNLLLRCYSFVQARPAAPRKPSRPQLVIVSDSFVDHDHAELKPRYWTNTAEVSGKSGQDDDKNGFIDDVYGWNIPDDTPLRAPLLANMADELNSDLLRKFVTLYNRDAVPTFAENANDWKDQKLGDLKSQYENPLVRQLGFDTLVKQEVELNDFIFTRMLVGASHGTHVAGIVVKSSDGRAQIHGLTHGRFQTPREAKDSIIRLGRTLAPRTITYEQYVMKLREVLLDEALHYGARRSAYLRSTGAGVMNLSWVQSKGWFLRTADALKDIYDDHGMDPASIDRYDPPADLDLSGDLGLELLVNAAAELALMIHQNPDVLFVIAAGNEGEDNDEEFPSPAYLSRFFPNVITVASVDAANQLSKFSNFGLASVQVAAPGEDIYSTFLANQAGFMSGTSMAAPAVAGLAARIRSDHPQLTASDLRLIIERSVAPLEPLQSKIACGGIIDAAAAIELAKKWQAGSRADMTLAALSIPRKQPAQAGTPAEAAAKKATEHVATVIATGPDDKGARISAIGGFADQWRIIMSTGTPFTEQAVHPMGKLPIDWIKRKWLSGWEITSIGGESGNWRVVMSPGSRREQKLLGLDFDKSSIDQLLSVGYRITAQAGYSREWVFVLTAKTGWKEQRYSFPGAWDDKKRAAIAESLKEGYRITSIAGDNDPKNAARHCWVVVMTRGTQMGDQVFTGPSAWPDGWIAEQEKKGYRITQCSGYDDHWVVVMTQGTKFEKQSVSAQGPWNDEWVKGIWQGQGNE